MNFFKIFSTLSLIFFMLKGNPGYTQKLFTLDEMLTLSKYKDVVAFEKALNPFGYNKVTTPSPPASVAELYTFTTNQNPATGTYNRVDWIVFKEKGSLQQYVNFGFADKVHYNEVVSLLMKRGYGTVKSAIKDLGGGFKAYIQFVRNETTGLQLTISDALIYPSTKISTCEISITSIHTDKWP
jgi:hypothetical protein